MYIDSLKQLWFSLNDIHQPQLHVLIWKYVHVQSIFLKPAHNVNGCMVQCTEGKCIHSLADCKDLDVDTNKFVQDDRVEPHEGDVYLLELANVLEKHRCCSLTDSRNNLCKQSVIKKSFL